MRPLLGASVSQGCDHGHIAIEIIGNKVTDKNQNDSSGWTMPFRQRLELIADRIKAICDFIKIVSFYLLEAGAFLLILYLVGRAAWTGL